MAMAILPAQDCLDEDRALMCNPRRMSNRSKMKSIGETRGSGKLNPKISGLNPQNFQKNGSFLSGSSSYVSSENLASRTISPAFMHWTQAPASNFSYYLPGPSNTFGLPWESVCYDGSRAWQSSVDDMKSNGTIHQASRSCRHKGIDDSQQQHGQKGLKGFLLEKTEGDFRKEGFIDGINKREIGNDLQMGQLNILKSASLTESALAHLLKPSSSEKHEIPEKPRTVEASKRETKISAKNNGLYHRADIGKGSKLNNDAIVITSTEHFGPDPSNLPRESSGLLRSVSSGLALTETVIDNVPRSSWEAVDNLKAGGNPDLTIFCFDSDKRGVPAFTNSPPPSSLPLPKFSLKQNGKPATTQVGVNTMATRDLRRLLGLDY